MKKLMLDLANHECKYPVEFDRNVVGHYYFCAEATEKECSYCPKHKQQLTDKTTYRRL